MATNDVNEMVINLEQPSNSMENHTVSVQTPSSDYSDQFGDNWGIPGYATFCRFHPSYC